MGIGKSLNRVDALAKVTGQTKYCEDLVPNNALHVKIVHSTIANGRVLSVDTAEASKMPGVKYILTCFDVPDKQFTIAGHPLSLDPAGEDISDRNILAKRVRFYGDDVACVVADTLLNAENAVSKIKVEYEEYEPYFEPHEAFGKEAIHEEYPGNELARLDFTVDENDDSHFYTGSFSNDLRIAGRDDMVGEHFSVPQVNACHIENTGCFAYMDGEKIIVVTTTQAPVAVSTPAPTSVPAPSFNNISASSTRGADYTSGHAITYELQKAFDGSFETAWSCDRDYEITPTITLKANTPQYVSGVRIANGYFKSEATYQYNRRITKFEIDYDGGNTVYSCGIDQYRIMQDIKFEHPVCTSTLAIKVLETVDGKWHDVSISEIEIY